MHVLCFGAGAIGSLVGARLSESGVAVTLLARRDHVAAIRTRGLIVETPRGRTVCKTIDSIARLDDLATPPDLILLTVKAYHTAEALEALRPLLRDPVGVVSLQNGVGNEEMIAAASGTPRTFAGSITIRASRPRPGVVRQHTLVGGIGVAPLDPTQDPSGLVGLFRGAGFRTLPYREYRPMKWSKLLLNLFTNATSAILDMPPAVVIEDPRLFELERGALREARRVMRASGMRPVALPGYPVPLFQAALGAPRWLVRPIVRRLVRRGRGEEMPSLWQDLHRGRPESEVEVLNGAVAREGARLGVGTPINVTLTEVLRGLALGRLSPTEFLRRPDALLALVARADR
jgi:2-dehydropantoate 2-reductase